MSKAKKSFLTYLMPLLTAALLLSLVSISIYRLYTQSHTIINDLIVDHIEELTRIFKEIDTDCHIIGFNHEKNYIDFLNVKSFEGSEIGSMNLAYPDQWKGPYIQDNPTIQEKLYVVIVTKHGYYIAPGDGVELSDGKVIGKDIILNAETDFNSLTKGNGLLANNNQPLVCMFKSF